jgi:threonine/homoserine/homoserine lactone efflux protein
VVGAIVLTLAGPGDASEEGQPATWVSWLRLVLGVLLAAGGGAPVPRSSPRGEAAPGQVDGGDRPVQGRAGAGRGAALAAANPKNLLLAVGGPAAIAQTGIPDGQQAIAYAVFAVIGPSGWVAPVGICFVTGKRSAELLGRLKDWMGHNNAVIMAVLCLVISVKLVGDALSGLGS